MLRCDQDQDSFSINLLNHGTCRLWRPRGLRTRSPAVEEEEVEVVVGVMPVLCYYYFSRREAAQRDTTRHSRGRHTMQSLCYPYGSGITCVCDRGEIFKCFPDLKSDHVGGPGGLHGQGKAGSGVMVGANTQISDNNGMEDTLDRRSVSHFSHFSHGIQ